MKFTETHEWIRIDGNIGTIGITKHAKNELGDIVYVELPKIGSKVKAGDEVCVLESTKAAADIYSPVSGKITAVHEDLSSSVEAINQSPEEKGWLFRIELEKPDEVATLLSKEKYEQFVRESN